MVGTALKTRSDTGAALRAFRDAGLFDRWPIDYVVSHREGSGLLRALKAIDGILVFLALACRHPRAVLHVHSASGCSFWRKAIFMAIALAARWPVVFHLHGTGFATFYDAHCGPLRRAIVRFFLDRASCIVVVSQRWSSWMTRTSRNANVVTIATPVRTPAAVPPRERHLLACPLPGPDAPGAAELIAAVASLAPRFPELRIAWAGEGACARATAFVMPTFATGQAPLLEAMASGCPVVACATGSTPDIVDDGFNGLLVPPRDAEAMAAAIDRLLSQPALAREMGRAARATIASRFSPEVSVARLGRVYEQLGVSQQAPEEPRPLRAFPPIVPGAPFAARRFQESP